MASEHRELERVAGEILELKEKLKLRRPILIEFCGSPKAGKTTTINSLNIFLKRNGFTTKVLSERADICPVPKKTHPFFNIWTLCSAVAEIVTYLYGDSKEVDIIVADRGIFDALCWFEWLSTNDSSEHPYLDHESFQILENFATMKMWQKRIDIIYVFQVPPETSIEREYATLLTDKKGSIMNESVLATYNEAIDNVIRKHGQKFRKIEKISTHKNNPNEVGLNVTKTILNSLRNLLEERIAYFDEKESQELKRKLADGHNPIELIDGTPLQYGLRDSIENNFTLIQPIPIAVITNKQRDKVLVVRKNEKSISKGSPEKDKLLLYVGGHVREEDSHQTTSTFQIYKNCIVREVEEELGESLTLENVSAKYLIYDSSVDKSRKHLAICYVLEVDLENRQFSPTSEEFILKKGRSKSGRVLEVREIISSETAFEAWTETILRQIFKADLRPKLDLFNYKEIDSANR